MLPDFTTTPKVVDVPPPPHFRPLQGTPKHVAMMSDLRYAGVGLTDAQKAGLRYEAKAQIHLQSLLGRSYRASPILRYDDGEVRRCIPDGIYQQEGIFTIFEIKSQHMPEAWWQLRRLYEPVLKELRGVKEIRVVEVTKSFDAGMPFPEKITLISNLKDFVTKSWVPRHFGVWIWRP